MALPSRALGAGDHHLGEEAQVRRGRQRDVVEGSRIALPCPVLSRRRSAARIAMTAYSPRLTSQAGSTWFTGPRWSGGARHEEIRWPR